MYHLNILNIILLLMFIKVFICDRLMAREGWRQVDVSQPRPWCYLRATGLEARKQYYTVDCIRYSTVERVLKYR
jgi:hypothetical protein